MIASGVAPGLTRKRFGFESWVDHDPAGWQAAREAAVSRVKIPRKLRLVGSESSNNRVAEAEAHLANHPHVGGLMEWASFERRAAEDFAPRPGWNGMVVSNMPYGERVGEDVEPLHEHFGERLRRLSGYSVSLLTGSSRLAGLLRLSNAERTRVLNGGIECQLVTAQIP